MTTLNYFKQPYKLTFQALTIFTSLFLFFLLSSCKGQVNTNENLTKPKDDLGLSLFNDSLNRPDVNVKVNKRYDENGNIIKYDSTYTYVYKGGSNGRPLNNDTLFKQFKAYFNKQSLNQLGIHGDDVFFNDSLFQYDFFNEDYFQKRFELNQGLFRDFFKQMDSLKGGYLNENYLYQGKK